MKTPLKLAPLYLPLFVTCEHLKMVFWPGIFFAVIEYTYVREKVNNYLIAKTASLFVMPLVITLGWYLYTPFTQKSIYKVDLFLFYLAVLIGQMITYKLMTRSRLSKKVNNFAMGSLVVMLIAFSTLTFNPPHMFLFEHLGLKDTGQFGILPYEDNIRYFTKPPSP